MPIRGMNVMSKKKTLIVLDEVKDRHTSHWDDDMLSWQQLERAYDEGREQRRRYKRRQYLWIAFWLAMLCLHPTLLYWLGRVFA